VRYGVEDPNRRVKLDLINSGDDFRVAEETFKIFNREVAHSCNDGDKTLVWDGLG
jgi:hypothetical protein